MKHQRIKSLAVFFALFACLETVVADNRYVTAGDATGVTPFGSYEGTNENIDLLNLNLGVTIPLFTLKGRNGLDYSVVAASNSIYRVWRFIPDQYVPPYYDFAYIEEGIGPSFDILPVPRLSYKDEVYMDGSTEMHTNRWILVETDGTRREFGVAPEALDCICWGSCGYNTYRSTDSSYMKLVSSSNGVDVYRKDGTLLHFGANLEYIRDTNGNQITFAYNTGGYDVVATDTLGRTISFLLPSDGDKVVRVKKGDGTELSYVLTRWSEQLRLPGGDTNPALRYVFTTQQISPLVDPQGQSYPEYGWELKPDRITYPSGGYTEYDWATESIEGRSPVKLASKTVNANDGQGPALWSYDNWGSTRVTRPDLSYEYHGFGYVGFQQVEGSVEYYEANGTKKKTISKTWAELYGDPRLTEEKTILNDTGYQKKVTYAYDSDGFSSPRGSLSNGNVEEICEYNWGYSAPGSLERRTTRDHLSTTSYNVYNRHILNRVTNETIYDGSGSPKAQTTFSYDTYTSPRTLLSTSGVVQHDASFGTSFYTRGNLYRIARWLDSPSSTFYTYFRYDICGNVRETTDPRGYTSYVDYNSTYQYAYPYQLRNPLSHATTRTYDFNNTYKRGFGYLLSETDPNTKTTSYSYDNLGRVKTINIPNGGLVENYYSDYDLTVQRSSSYVFKARTSSLPPRMKTFTKIDTALERVDVTGFDGLGRSVFSGVSNGTQQDWTRSEFDSTGRPWRTSNPRTMTLGSTVDLPAPGDFTKWITKTYDGLDRVTRITKQDGQYVQVDYSGYARLVTDELGNKRRLKYDALGRISSAVEPNLTNGLVDPETYVTSYYYNVRDQLTCVTQDAQGRTFNYDSLGRLRSTTNPEAGTITYSYDANSNLTQKADARGYSVNYNSYDALNRPASISYSDGTPTVTLTYDSVSVTNGKGRRTGMSDSAFPGRRRTTTTPSAEPRRSSGRRPISPKPGNSSTTRWAVSSSRSGRGSMTMPARL